MSRRCRRPRAISRWKCGLLPNVGLKAFRNGNTVVVDLVGWAAGSAAPEPVQPQPAATSCRRLDQRLVPAASRRRPLKRRRAPAPAPDGQCAGFAIGTTHCRFSDGADRAAGRRGRAAGDRHQGTGSAKPAQPPAPVAITAQAAPAQNGATLDFTFPKATGLAVFKRGDALWLAFDRPGPLDVPALVKAAPSLTGLARVETPYATVLRLPSLEKLGGSDMGAKISGDGRHWQISLGPGATIARPRASTSAVNRSPMAALRLLLQATRPGPVITLTIRRPATRFLVVPLLTAGRRHRRWRRLARFPGSAELFRASWWCRSATGPVSRRLPEWRRRDHRRPAGRGRRPGGAQADFETEPPPAEPRGRPRHTAGGGGPSHDRGRIAGCRCGPRRGARRWRQDVVGIFDQPRWRRGGEANFASDEAALSEAVGAASNSDKPLARLALAQFHFAHGRYPETLDDLALLDKRAEDGDKDVLTLRGAALTLVDRPAEASGRS